MLKVILAVIFILIFFAQPSYAHLVGQPPFFKILGVYSNLYPVPMSSLSDFNLPQDLAAENYLINQNLDFVLNVNLLPVPADIVAKTAFVWDFGDGTHGKGIKNSHTYSKPGSYILNITAQYGNEQASLIESVMLNILPDKNYHLPVAVIKINNQKSKDPLTDIIKVNFNADINFDASDSVPGSSKIVSYFFDFGDESSNSSKIANHSYSRKSGLSTSFPLLRVKDENGFIADAFVEIEDQNLSAKNNQPSAPISKDAVPQIFKTSAKHSGPNKLLIAILLILVIAGILMFTARWLLQVRRRGKQR
jgi:hypothetical protein